MLTIYFVHCDNCGQRVRSDPEPEIWAEDEEKTAFWEDWKARIAAFWERHCCKCWDSESSGLGDGSLLT